MAKSKIYTGQGDNGFTSLAGGKKIAKTSLRVDAYGTVDELNSFVALLLEEIDDREDRDFLSEIQNELFSVGSYLASEAGFLSCTINADKIEKIESEMDEIDTLVPPIRAFILPGGCKENALAHVCRTVCRRAERCIYKLRETEEVDELLLKYVNRLSDYFFLFARKQNFLKNIDEIIWENTCK
jgi:ATP:cob(I)alamin adenosyltransferase